MLSLCYSVSNAAIDAPNAVIVLLWHSECLYMPFRLQKLYVQLLPICNVPPPPPSTYYAVGVRAKEADDATGE